MIDEKDIDKQLLPFEERMKLRVSADLREGELYLAEYHSWCKDMFRFYHNAQNYEELKKKNKFPSTAIQEDVDQFIADARDKLFYVDRPCTLFGREETDKADAEAKQEMMNYQDEEIGIFEIIGNALKDAALYKIAPLKVEYDEVTETEWEPYEEGIPLVDKDNQPILDGMGRMIPQLDTITGEPVIESGWRLIEAPRYKGAVVHRIDPLNLFWTQDKKTMDDRYPIMIKSNISFKDMEKPYFIKSAVQILKEKGTESQYEDPTWEKKKLTGENATVTGTSKKNQYVEWQGMVNKAVLYHFMIQTKQVPDEDMEQFMLDLSTTKPTDECWCICGLANETEVIQLRCSPFKKLNRANIIIGKMSPGEDSLIGDSISRKIEAVQKSEEETYGMLIENIKQAVDAFWIINTEALVDIRGGKVEVNRAGGVLRCNENVNNVAKRIDQPGVAPDIYNLLNIFKQARQDQGGLQDSVIGKGDPNAETLGEARQVLNYASLRMRDYLKTIENSLIRPLYRMRNDINTEYLTDDYVFRIIGEKGSEWRKLTPQTIRTPVDFICESSTRETNRSVIIQQMLQMIEISPLAQAQGQPVRIDLMLADLAENGFAISKDKIKKYFPAVAAEEEGVNAGMVQPQEQQPSVNSQMPHPVTEEQAIVSNEAKTNVTI